MNAKITQTIRKFNRFELKYLLSLRQAENMKTALLDYMVPDEYGNQQGHYDISNLYYDSPELRCYWEKESGLRVRRKLRLRNYNGEEIITEDTPVFLEIKQRVDRVTQKRRAVLLYCEALRLCNDRQIPDHAAQDQKVIEEIYAFVWQYNLRPMSIVRYHRQAFMGAAYDAGLRVTFDTDLCSQSHSLYLHDQSEGTRMFPADQVIMEIKVNERIPLWLTELIAHHNLQLDHFSKYSRSIDVSTSESSLLNRFLPAERARDILDTTYSIYNPPSQPMEVRRNDPTNETKKPGDK